MNKGLSYCSSRELTKYCAAVQIAQVRIVDISLSAMSSRQALGLPLGQVSFFCSFAVNSSTSAIALLTSSMCAQAGESSGTVLVSYSEVMRRVMDSLSKTIE